MARSVYPASGSFWEIYVSFYDYCEEVCGVDLENTEDLSLEWESFVSYIYETFKKNFPSFEWNNNEWIEREQLVLAENGLFYLCISEYCGAVCISLKPKNEDYCGYELPNMNNLCRGWLNRVEKKLDKIAKELNGYVKVGCFSNGECVFEKIK